MFDDFIRKNYDYGDGLYQNMSDYKSVADFLRKKRKARRKHLLNNYDSNRANDSYKKNKERILKQLYELNKQEDKAKLNNDLELIKIIQEKKNQLIETGSISIPKEKVLLRQRETSSEMTNLMANERRKGSILGSLDRLRQAIQSKKKDCKNGLKRLLLGKLDILSIADAEEQISSQIKNELLEINLITNELFKLVFNNKNVPSSIIERFQTQIDNFNFGAHTFGNYLYNYENIKTIMNVVLDKINEQHMDKNNIDFPLDQYLPEEYTGQSALNGYSDKINSDQYYTLPDEKAVELRIDKNPTHYIEGDPDLIPFLN